MHRAVVFNHIESGKQAFGAQDMSPFHKICYKMLGLTHRKTIRMAKFRCKSKHAK